MLRDIQLVAHIVPDLLPDDETTPLSADFCTAALQRDDRAPERVLGLAVSHAQAVAVVELLVFGP